MPLDFQTARRLAFIRYLHLFGIQQARLPAPMDSVSILMLHDAVETFLGLAAEHLETPGSYDFEKYFPVINAKLADGVVLTTQPGMKRLNKARVALKHHGALQDSTTIAQAVTDVGTFMAANTQLVFGVDYDSVSMADAIPQQGISNLVRTADQANSVQDRVAAMCSLAQAAEALVNPPRFFDPSLEDVTLGFDAGSDLRQLQKRTVFEAFKVEITDGDHRHRVEPRRGAEDVANHLEAMTNAVRKIQSAMRITALGIDYSAYLRFRRLTPSPIRYIDARLELRAVQGYNPAEEDFAFCYHFVVGLALRLAEIEQHQTLPTWMPPRHERQWETIKTITYDEQRASLS